MTDDGVPGDELLRDRLTGLCTYLVQSPPFSPGDVVCLTVRYEQVEDAADGRIVPLNVTHPNESKEALSAGERSWGETVFLVRAKLEETGGWPRDSMGVPTDEYIPDALSLSDVEIVDRSCPTDIA